VAQSKDVLAWFLWTDAVKTSDSAAAGLVHLLSYRGPIAPRAATCRASFVPPIPRGCFLGQIKVDKSAQAADFPGFAG